MTPRQRWLALLADRSADRIPTDYQATDEVTAHLLPQLNCSDEEPLCRKPNIDKRRLVQSRCALEHQPHDPQADVRRFEKNLSGLAPGID